MELSGYRWMWIVAMFDLPVYDKALRKAYALFRKQLLADGFMRMQYSVYVRHCASRENADVHLQRVELAVPPNGEVRILALTDKQFERMRVYLGKNRIAVESPPQQLELF